MKKHTLAQQAIEAAVEAIEKNGFRLVMPIEYRFEVTHVPEAARPRVYPESQSGALALNEGLPKDKKN